MSEWTMTTNPLLSLWITNPRQLPSAQKKKKKKITKIQREEIEMGKLIICRINYTVI